MILCGGAAGGGKSYLGSCWLISSCLRWPDMRMVVARKTLKSLRETGRLAFTQIQRKIYYRPEDVEKLMAYVAMKRKEKAVREKRKNE